MNYFAHDVTESQPWNSISSVLVLNLGPTYSFHLQQRYYVNEKKNEVNKNSVSGAAKSFKCSVTYCRVTFKGFVLFDKSTLCLQEQQTMYLLYQKNAKYKQVKFVQGLMTFQGSESYLIPSSHAQLGISNQIISIKIYFSPLSPWTLQDHINKNTKQVILYFNFYFE